MVIQYTVKISLCNEKQGVLCHCWRGSKLRDFNKIMPVPFACESSHILYEPEDSDHTSQVHFYFIISTFISCKFTQFYHIILLNQYSIMILSN